MPTIDADAHVIETDETWQYMEPAERKALSKAVSASGDDLWVVEGRVFVRRRNVGADTTVDAQEMRDIKGRLRHMDALGIDVQVLYPSLFLIPITDRPETEVAMYRSYNRWLADIWAQGEGRLRWAVMAPTRVMDEALAELRWAKEHGACAVFIRGIEAGRYINDPYFFPLYAEASRLDMPICLHAGASNFGMHEITGAEAIHKFKAPVFCAFDSLVCSDVPAQFPALRFGFIETSAQWVPYVVHQIRRRYERRNKQLPETFMRDYRLYVACETHDDLPYVLKYTGEDNVVLGTDYGHSDPTTELDALQALEQRGAVRADVARRILEDNPRALYGL
jgi:predicted TIM-barrel fold metal-dependent hydrolase